MNKKEYEEQLLQKQIMHLIAVKAGQDDNWKPCKHDECTSCYGTGIKLDGTKCIHNISCDCPKCKLQ